MAASFVDGLQSEGILATVKHFVANEQETERLTVDERISDRALREIFLRPFEIVVKDANPAAIMTAYNKVNGEHMDSNAPLIQKVLREQWGWDGLIMSDWGGTNSTVEALVAGLDLEMPGPTRWRDKDVVRAAVESGKLDESTITQRARRVLEFLHRGNRFGDAKTAANSNEQSTQALIREAGGKGIVLLKNEADILPLTKAKVKGKKIALLGHVKDCLAHGGGSAAVDAHHYTSVWDALHTAFGDDVELIYSKGQSQPVSLAIRKWVELRVPMCY
jgi:beta-glucosidase